MRSNVPHTAPTGVKKAFVVLLGSKESVFKQESLQYKAEQLPEGKLGLSKIPSLAWAVAFRRAAAE